MRDERDVLAQFSPSIPYGSDAPLRARLLDGLTRFLGSQKVTSGLASGEVDQQFQNGGSADELLSLGDYGAYLENTIIPQSTNVSSPRSMGHMAGIVPHFLRPLAEVIVALNQNLVKREASRAFTLLERETIGMMHEVVYGFSRDFYAEHAQRRESCLGIMTAGGSLANIIALWIARNRVFPAADGFAGVEHEGIDAALERDGARNAVIIGSSLMHYSIDKAAGLLGLGGARVIKLAVDGRNRVDANELRDTVGEYCVKNVRVVALIGTAGTTDYGSIDPLCAMAEVAHDFGIHYHVDAAWGAPLLFSERHRKQLLGIDQACSVTVDGHKQMHLPLGCSLLLLRDPHAARAIEKDAPYMLHPGSGDLGSRSLEGSRSGAALFMHAALKILGKSGYAKVIELKIDAAQAMAARIRARPEFELLAEPETNIVLYRYLPPPWRRMRNGELTSRDARAINDFNTRLQKAQYEAGSSCVSRTTVNGPRATGHGVTVALRAVIANPLTGDADIEAVLRDQLLIGEAIWAEWEGTDTGFAGSTETDIYTATPRRPDTVHPPWVSRPLPLRQTPRKETS